MRTSVLSLVCLACICDSRRVQTRMPADEGEFEESGNLISLVELSQNVSGIEAIEILKYDFANMFSREPRWNNFAQYFTLIDRSTGGGLFGRNATQKFTKLIRLMYKKFSVKQFKIDFIEQNWVETKWKDERFKSETKQPSEGSVVALFTVELARKASPKNFIVLEGQVNFRLSKTNKVAHAEVVSTLVDGFQVMPMLWPDVDFEQEKDHQENIDEWLQKLSTATEHAMKKSESGAYEPVLGVGNIPEDAGTDKILQTLKTDFAKILRKEPNWNAFADNLTLVDQTGTSLVGLELNQLLAKLLRKLPRKFLFKDIYVTFYDRHVMLSSWQDGRLKRKIQEPYEPQVIAIWQLDLNTKAGRFRSNGPPLTLQAETVFTLDAERNKIETIQILNILVNEWDLIQWPDVDLTETAEISMEYIEQWIEDIKSQIANPEEISGEEYNPELVQDLLSVSDEGQDDIGLPDNDQ